MQNLLDQSDQYSCQDDTDCDKQFSEDVIRYQSQVENVVGWLLEKQEQLQSRPDESSLQEAPFHQVLEEYEKHEKFMIEFSEFSHVIMQTKEAGQEMKESLSLTEEDRDDVGLQMDLMMAHHDTLRGLAGDRLLALQRISKEKQQKKIERSEEWLSAIQMKIARSSNDIGPDHGAIEIQIRDMDELRVELERKQDFLNFMSSVIVFDDVDPTSLQIRSQSCDSLDERLEDMNRRWTDICRFVDDRTNRLKRADAIWRILNLQGPQLNEWLRKIGSSLDEVSSATRNVSDVQADKLFLNKLIARSSKIDADIKSKQSFYTSLENRVRTEIEKFDDPCGMLVIGLERRLEELQDSWNSIMNRKRMLDYDLQALSNPARLEQVHCNMIPLPDPITATSNSNLHFNPAIVEGFLATESKQIKNKKTLNEHLSTPSSDDEKDTSLGLNGSLSETRANLDTSLSTTSRSFPYCNNHEQAHTLFNKDTESQDEISSMTASYPINVVADRISEDVRYSSTEPPTDVNLSNKLRPSESISDVDCGFLDDHSKGGSHSCRVEEWKHSLESFSTWLRHVETSLGLDPALDNLVGNRQLRPVWSQLDAHRQLLLLLETENKIASTCQDEFDCLILQGQQIIEDLMPEIGLNEYETNLKEILADIEFRYSSVKRCLVEKRLELLDKDKWVKLMKIIQDLCHYLIEQMDQIMPETNIGVDLISLAQQQDELMHAKNDLSNNNLIHTSMQDAKLFLKICDTLQQQYSQTKTLYEIDGNQPAPTGVNNVIHDNYHEDNWLSFKELREDMEGQLDRLTLHYSELSQLINDRLSRLDEVHKEMHSLQHKMQELATSLQVAEILKSNWVPLENLTIEKLSEQLEDLKMFRERLSETETIHKVMNSIFEWMTKFDVPLSQQNLKRISELNTIWSLIQVSVEERQRLIEQAFDNQGASEQRFLTQTLADMPRWERRVATSRVPYFIDHETNLTKWDHPKFTDLLKTMSIVKQYKFSAYRTAVKLRTIQKKLGIDLLMLDQLKEILDSTNHGLSEHVKGELTAGETYQVFTNVESMIGVEQIIFFLKVIYEKIQKEEKPTLDVPLSIDLTLNWLLNLYDATRTGYISVLSLRVGLALLCCETREGKYKYMYDLVANRRTGSVDARRLGTLFETCMRIPTYLGEGDSFGGSEIIESGIRHCFSISKFNPQQPNCIDREDYLSWLKSEPQFIIWLSVLHRLLISENIVHEVKCKLCRAKPIIGLRYRCLKCFKFNVCQNCFLFGRHLYEHFDPSKHPMQEYCCATSSGEDVRDLTKILRNKLKTTKSSVRSASVPNSPMKIRGS